MINARVVIRFALSIAASIVVLSGCGGGSGGTSTAPYLPVAAQFNMAFENAVVVGTTQSGVSFQLENWSKKCLQFPVPFADTDLAYGDTASRIVWLVDCGTTGSFTAKFHALDVQLADTVVSWTVSESGMAQTVVTQGGLCVQQSGGTSLTERITAKTSSSCP